MAGGKPATKLGVGEASERFLVEAAQKEPARFSDLYVRNFELVYAYISRRVRDRQTVEDLTSEVFHKALANLRRFKWSGAPFAAWLFRIASNVIADQARRAARQSTAAPGHEPVSKLRDPQESTQSVLEEVERRASIFRLIDELAEDQRRVVMMRFAEEKSIRNIAQELGRSEGAVKQLQFRALENLRARLTNE
jgi:RNA polymerase sigma-70 factor (ECF subfamily)